MADRKFGISGNTGFGVMQSKSLESAAQVAEALGQDGQADAQIAYSVEKTQTFEFVANDTFLGTEAGTIVTGPDLTGIATSAARNETNSGYATGTVTITKKDAAAQTAYTQAAS